MGLLVIAMGIGPFMIWKRGLTPKSRHIWVFGAGITGVICFIFIKANTSLSIPALAGIGAVTWLSATILSDIFIRVRVLNRNNKHNFWQRIVHLQWSMWIAHLGVVIFLIGALGESIFRTEAISRMQIGEQISIGTHKAELKSISMRAGSNFEALIAALSISDGKNNHIGTLYPEKRIYPVEKQTTTEAAIRRKLTHDYYAVLGDGNKADGYTIRIYYKPFVSWIWVGVILMASGAMISILLKHIINKQTSTTLQS